MRLFQEFVKKKNIPYKVGESGFENSTCNYLICGGDRYPETTIPHDKKVLIVHGIGTKVSAFYRR